MHFKKISALQSYITLPTQHSLTKIITSSYYSKVKNIIAVHS